MTDDAASSLRICFARWNAVIAAVKSKPSVARQLSQVDVSDLHNASVILNGSIASIKGIPAFSVYNATKAAVRSFARSWILDLKGTGIRVNVLSPGHTDTPGLSNLLADDDKAGVVANIPLNRLGTPDDMSRAAVFLASEDSAYITGVELFVDGGVAQY